MCKEVLSSLSRDVLCTGSPFSVSSSEATGVDQALLRDSKIKKKYSRKLRGREFNCGNSR